MSPAARMSLAWQAAAGRRTLLATGDRDEARAVVSRVFKPHGLEPQRQAAVAASMQHLGHGLLGLSVLAYGDTVDILPGPLGDFYLLQWPLAGAADIHTAGESFRSDAGCASLLSPAPDLRMRWHAGNAQVCLRVEAALLQRQIAAWTGRAPARLPVFRPQVPMDRHPALAALLLEIVDTQAPGTLAVADREQRLLALLLGALPHDAPLDLAAPPATPRAVRLVEEHLRARCDEPWTPESMAALAGVSARSLFLGFRRHRGISPMRLLRELRLRRVREELLAGGSAARVTDIALRWGFSHLGRFAQDYRRAYGETPAQTLRT